MNNTDYYHWEQILRAVQTLVDAKIRGANDSALDEQAYQLAQPIVENLAGLQRTFPRDYAELSPEAKDPNPKGVIMNMVEKLGEIIDEAGAITARRSRTGRLLRFRVMNTTRQGESIGIRQDFDDNDEPTQITISQHRLLPNGTVQGLFAIFDSRMHTLRVTKIIHGGLRDSTEPIWTEEEIEYQLERLATLDALKNDTQPRILKGEYATEATTDDVRDLINALRGAHDNKQVLRRILLSADNALDTPLNEGGYPFRNPRGYEGNLDET